MKIKGKKVNINKKYPYESEPVTQTLQGLNEDQQNTKKVDASIQASISNTRDSAGDKVTKVYEPKPLTPQDPIYSDIMEQFGARPVKPKYWFEEFGDYWSCSCGHINNSETCENCGLERNLLRKLFVLHKPADAASKASDRIEKARKEPAVIPAIAPIADTKGEGDAFHEPENSTHTEAQSNQLTVSDAASPLAVKSGNNKSNTSKFDAKTRNIIVAIIAAFVLAFAGGGIYYNSVKVQDIYYGSLSGFADVAVYKDLNSQLKTIVKYAATDDLKRNSYIAVGDNCLKKKKYSKALSAYKAAQDIKDDNDIKDKINSAKFAYVEANQDNGGDQFESYLNELKKASYPGINEIYDKYYAWHMKIIANGSEDDFSNNQTTFRRSDTVFFHVSLSGGEPDEKIKLYYSLLWPSGARETQRFDSQWKSGSKITAHFSYPIALFGETGKMTFKVFDSESNEELGSCSVNFVD